MGREYEIRLIAYRIWEEESCPDGKDGEHWFRAEVIWAQQQKQRNMTQSNEVGSKEAVKQSTKTLVAKKKSQKT